MYLFDWLARSTIDVLMQIKVLTERSIRLVILKQGFDTDTSARKLALTIFAAFAELKNGIKEERQIKSIARVRTEGKYQGRKASCAVCAKIKKCATSV